MLHAHKKPKCNLWGQQGFANRRKNLTLVRETSDISRMYNKGEVEGSNDAVQVCACADSLTARMRNK